MPKKITIVGGDPNRLFVSPALRRGDFKADGYSNEDVRLIQRFLRHDDETGRRRRGRERKWTGALQRRFLQEMGEECGGPPSGGSRKTSAAARKLAEREPWASLVEAQGSRTKADVLRELYVRLWMASIEVYGVPDADGNYDKGPLILMRKPKGAVRSGAGALKQAKKRSAKGI